MSTATPPDIPGFYFDREKNRYFKLLANHAGPTASFYTPDSVRKRGEQRRRRQPTPSPPPAKRRSNGPTSLLAHELGNSTTNSRRLSKAELYATGLTEYQLVQGSSVDEVTTVFALNNGDNVVFIVGYLSGGIKTHVAKAEADGVFRCDKMLSREHPYLLSGQVTSVIPSHSGKILLSSFGGSGVNLRAFTLSREGTLRPSAIHPKYANLGPTRASAHSLPHGAIVFADDLGVHFSPGSRVRSPSHIFSLAFSTNYTLLTGARDGCVRSADLRSGSGSNFWSLPVRHGDSIRHVKALGDPSSPSSYFVVSGLRKCALYDLRYCSSPATGTTTTRSVAEFNIADAGNRRITAEQEHAARLKYAFDVNAMGVVAVPDQYRSTVKLFDAYTGTQLEWSHGRRYSTATAAMTFHPFRMGDPQALVAADFDGSLTSYEY